MKGSESSRIRDIGIYTSDSEVNLTAGRDFVGRDMKKIIQIFVDSPDKAIDALQKDPEEFLLFQNEILTQYLRRLDSRYETRSRQFTELRISTDIRVASYKGKEAPSTNKIIQQYSFSKLLRGLSDEPIEPSEAMIILGEPGSGKSTMCEHYTWELARQGLSRIKSADNLFLENIPIFYELNTYRSSGNELKPVQKILSNLAGIMEGILEPAMGTGVMSQSLFQSFLREHHFVFFFDGLNEVGLNYREELLEGLKEFIRDYANYGHQFIITCRKLEYEYDLSRKFPSQQFKLFEVLELDGAGLQEFILRDLGNITRIEPFLEKLPESATDCYHELLRGESMNPKETLSKLLNILEEHQFQNNQVLEKDLTDAINLVETLNRKEYERVRWLAQNPSTIKDIIEVYKIYKTKGQQIPKSRSRIFEKAVQYRIENQKSKLLKKLEGELDLWHISNKEEVWKTRTEIKLDFLREMAKIMMAPDEGLSIPYEKGLRLMEASIEKKAEGLLATQYPKSRLAKTMIEELIFEENLLIERTKGWLFFIKQPYQEYFVADSLMQIWNDLNKKNKDFLRDSTFESLLSDSNNYRYIALMAGLLDPISATQFIRHLQSNKKTQRLAALSFRHVEELPQDLLDQFKKSTQKKIVRFFSVPDGVVQIIMSMLYICLLVFFILSSGPTFHIFWRNQLALNLPEWPVVFYRVIAAAIVIGLGLVFKRILDAQAKSQKDPLIFKMINRQILFFVIGFTLLGLFCPLGSPISYTMNFITAFALIMMVTRIIISATQPLAAKISNWIEESLISTFLIPNMETLRYLGPDAKDVIEDIKGRVQSSKFISSRIKKVILQTWTVSPKTVLKIIESINQEEQINLTEATETLGNKLFFSETKVALKEDIIGAMFKIIDQNKDQNAIYQTIEYLSSFGINQPAFEQIIKKKLHDVYKDKKTFDLLIRIAAWKGLRDMGIINLPAPVESVDNWLGRNRIWLLILLLATLLVVLLRFL